MRTCVPLLLASTGLLAACVEPLGTTPCIPVPFAQASVSGDTIATTTGLRYLNNAVGTGDTVRWCRTLTVHYTGYLLDGTKFDSSRDIDRPLVFTPGLGGLIEGFEQGVIGMRSGGVRRLIIPPALGYGSEPLRDNTGTIIVPGNSIVVFDVEILSIGT